MSTPPPTDSPLHAWLSTGDPEAYCGPLVISWVFFRDMTLRDEEGRYTYNPRFFARVVSQGRRPFVIQMTSAWHERANTTMALPACGRTVHYIPLRLVQAFLQARGHCDQRLFPDWLGVRTPHDGGRPPHALFARLSLSLGGCSAGQHHLLRFGTTGFWDTAPHRPRRAVNLMFEASGGVSTSFDPTLDFPGEGPSASPVPQWRFNSTPAICQKVSRDYTIVQQ